MSEEKCATCNHIKSHHRAVGPAWCPGLERGPCDFQRIEGLPGCDCRQYQPSATEIKREKDVEDLAKWPAEALALLRRAVHFIEIESVKEDVRACIRRGEQLGIDRSQD